LVSALTGMPLLTTLSPDIVARVLAHPSGGAKGLPAGARLVPILNKADLPGALEVGREVARGLLDSLAVHSVVIGAAVTEEPVREVWGRIGAIVLAAGRAERFGALKQIQPWGHLPLVAHVASRALQCAGIDRVAVTVGAEAETVASAAREAGEVEIVRVPDWSLGQSRSVKTGLAALRARSHAVLFLLADQPSVTPGLLSALIQRHRETLAPVVAPRFQGQRGNPVLFDSVTFPEFEDLEGDIGARPIIQRYRDQIAWVDWSSADIFSDIDTRADYDAAF
jgi:molybdenum cofactor cytidylyltransferase